jgi:Holliday junction resolvasome RuvABC endonuclease subunit
MGTYLKSIKGEKDLSDVLRLAFWKLYLDKILRSLAPDFVGIEGYAFRAQSNSAYQIGELGGIARITMWSLGIPYRVHDPMTIKLFAVGKGNSVADDLFFALSQNLQEKFLRLDPPKGKAQRRNTQTSRDLAVAYWVAKMVQIEVGLRDGTIMMHNLDIDQIQVFNRVTKKNPVNILARDWVCQH